MPVFKYKAVSDAGAEISDVIEAPNAVAVAEQLEKLGYVPVTIQPRSQLANLVLFQHRNRIKEKDVIYFTRQMATLLKAGVPLLASLGALTEQTDNELLKGIIRKIHIEIESGASFSDALGHHPRVFSEIYIQSVRAGEAGGALGVVLERLAQLMSHDHETRARIKSAMRYPTIVVISLVVAFIVLMVLVVPNFIDLFNKMNVELPLPTRILIGMHKVLVHYWSLLLAVLGLGWFAFSRYITTEKGAYLWDRLKLTMPVLGELQLKTAMSRFARMFETLNRSGLPVLQTLEITSRTLGNVVLGKEMERVSCGVLQGEGFAASLSTGKIFPPMVTHMIAIGEQSGALDEMLVKVSEHYDVEVDDAIKNLASMIEPLLTLVVGVMVLFLALAVFLPMWDLTNLVQ